MISKSLKQLIKGRLREFRREPSAFFFVIFMPILWMLLLGLSFANKPSDFYLMEAPPIAYIQFLIPGLLAISFLTTSMFGTGMTIVASRRENLLKRYLVTPMNPYEYIASHIIGRFVIMLLEMTIILITGWIIFNFKIQGSFWLFLATCMLGTSAFTALGILCGSRTKNTSTYHGLSNLIVMPMMFLSGVWFSRLSYPNWLNQIVKLLPLTALVDALRKIALANANLATINNELLILLAYTVLTVVLAKKLFRWL